MARTRDAGLEQALKDTLGADNIKKGTAAAGESNRVSFTMKRKNHDAHVYAPWKNDSARGPSGASVVASDPGTQSGCAKASRCSSSV